MSENHGESADFSLRQARGLVSDLFQVKPWIYWTDFLLCILAAHLCTAALVLLPYAFELTPFTSWTIQFICAMVAALLYHRCLLFIHELVHLRRGTMKLFRFAWNLLCGVPMLAPSFVYYTHLDHHRRARYGTEEDAEYLPMQYTPRIWIVYSLVQGIFVPLVLAIRFGIVSPFCLLFPAVRCYMHQHHSTVAIDPTYVRPSSSGNELRTILIQEAACFLWCVVAVIGLCQLPWDLAIRTVACVYIVFAMSSTLNAFRSAGSHRWSGKGEMTFNEQLADSLTYEKRPWLTELWAPVGTRFHALHHMFPLMPYHHLPEAHRRLMQGLPADSLYHATLCNSLFGQLLDLWKTAGQAKEKYRVFKFMREQTE